VPSISCPGSRPALLFSTALKARQFDLHGLRDLDRAVRPLPLREGGNADAKLASEGRATEGMLRAQGTKRITCQQKGSGFLPGGGFAGNGSFFRAMGDFLGTGETFFPGRMGPGDSTVGSPSIADGDTSRSMPKT